MPDFSFYGKELRNWPGPRLSTAAILGHTTATSARLWFRVFAPGSYQLVLREAERIDTRRIRVTRSRRPRVVNSRGREQAGFRLLEKRFSGSRDLTNVFDVEGLAPDTQYCFALRRKDVRNAFDWEWEIGRDTPLAFRTHALDPEQVCFGLYSCHMPFDGLDLRNMEMFTHFHEELVDARASFVIGGGDQVYTDGNDHLSIWRYLKGLKDEPVADRHMVSWYRDIYRGYWGMQPLQRVYRDFSNYMTWDDHEIKDGWGSYTDDELSDQLDTFWEWENKQRNLELARRMFEAAKRVYFEYEHSHNPQTDWKSGVWDYGFGCGRCGVYVLDGRGQRYYKSDRDAQILGRAQRERFESWLANDTSGFEVLFVVSAVPVVHARSFVVNWLDLPYTELRDDLVDHWEHESHQPERDWFLDLLFRNSHETGRRIVILSGDVHIAAAMKLYDAKHPQARVFQVTSSGITYAGLSDWKWGALKLVTRKKGRFELFERTKRKRRAVSYNALQPPVARNNFGIFRVRGLGGGDPEVGYDTFGKSDDAQGITRLVRLRL